MSFSVVTNLASLNAQASLSSTTLNLQKTLGRLTSGLRINSAADDAAGDEVQQGEPQRLDARRRQSIF